MIRERNAGLAGGGWSVSPRTVHLQLDINAGLLYASEKSFSVRALKGGWTCQRELSPDPALDLTCLPHRISSTRSLEQSCGK
jgi:hypothetical protein